MSKVDRVPHVDRVERDLGLDPIQRLAAVRATGAVPDDVGPEVPIAPARGPVRVVKTMAAYPAGEDGFEIKPAGHMGRHTLRCADAFDLMEAKAARHKKPAPFSPAQVAMGRHYRDLVEKHACAGVKCSSLESLSQGGGSGGDFMDAVLRDRQRIKVLRARIGTGSAMVVRRHRPSARGSRVAISDRRLVDIVCIEGGTISDVLRAHGWSIKSDLVTSLQVALGQVLDRMMGPVRQGGVVAAHYGSGPVSVWD